jgi:hypothetical protein
VPGPVAVLEDLKPNAAVRGVLPNGMLTVVSVHWFGFEALELTYKDGPRRLPQQQRSRELSHRRQAGFLSASGARVVAPTLVRDSALLSSLAPTCG